MYRILYITVRGDFGGGPRHVHQLIKNFSMNNEVYVAYPKEGKPYSELWNQNQQIKGHIYIPYRRFSFRTLIYLLRFISKNNIEIVHSHGNGAGMYSRLLKLLGCKAKIIHTFHGVSDEYSSVVKGFLNTMINRICKYYTDHFVLVSNGELDLCIKRRLLNPGRSTVIYNGISKTALPMARYSDSFDVVSLSRFDYQKNMDRAYCIANSFRKDKSYRFVWVGDGDDKERLQNLSESEKLNVIFTGFQTKPQEFLSQSSVYLSTSRFEGLPYALIEAASLGLPIIASNVKGNNEVVRHGFNGFLFTTDDEAVSYIKKLHDEPALWYIMSRNAYNLFEENFTETAMIEKIDLLYQHLLK